MCGVFGVVGHRPAQPLLLEALHHLEYRGYDSSGLATLSDGTLCVRRAAGKIRALESYLETNPVEGTVGIGHTRWATHGLPTTNNAHPHATQEVAVVHNGIISNHVALRKDLMSRGVTFLSDTDTEVIAHLATLYLQEGLSPQDTTQRLLQELEGLFSFVLLFRCDETLLIGARSGSPLVIGHGKEGMYFSSDLFALSFVVDSATYLEDGEWAVLTRHKATLYGKKGHVITRPPHALQMQAEFSSKEGYAHYMHKEIHEQPIAMGRTLANLCSLNRDGLFSFDLPFDGTRLTNLTIGACGTAYHAGLIGKFWIESLSGLAVDVVFASEVRRTRSFPHEAALFISQSGETMDTIECMRSFSRKGVPTFSIVNTPASTLARESDAFLHTNCGFEIGVASTKAFTGQLVALLCFALKLAVQREQMDQAQCAALLGQLKEAPRLVQDVCQEEEHIKLFAHSLIRSPYLLYTGRGLCYPLALEGALKMKEIAYIYSEGYAAGEIKHGPLALIEEGAVVIGLAPQDASFSKILANLSELKARGARLFVLSTEEGLKTVHTHLPGTQGYAMPACHTLLMPLLYSVPLQLLAYHTAVARGTDVDQPRNLAKSVTVE